MNGYIRALLIALVLPIAHGLFEDQAGTFDWYKQQVGGVKFASLHKTKPRAYIATKENVVASLYLRDGAIAWRHVLDESDQLDALITTEKPASVLTLSSNGKYFRSWDQADGALRWEVSTYSSYSSPLPTTLPGSMFLLDLSADSQAVAIFSNGQLHLFDTVDGHQTWGTSLPSIHTSHVHLVHDKAASNLVLFALYPGTKRVQVVVISQSTGSISTQQEFSSEFALTDIATTSGQFLAALSTDKQDVCVSSVFGVLCTAVTVNANIQPSSRLHLLPSPTGFTLTSSDPTAPGAALLSLTPSGALQLVKHYPTATIATPPTHFQDTAAVAFLDTPPSSPATLLVVDHTGNTLHSESFPSLGISPASGSPPQLASAFLGTFRRRESTEGIRILLSFEDAAISLLQQGQAVWAREEALASITATLFEELPAARSAAQSASSKAGFSNQLRLQLLSLKTQLQFHTPEEAAELSRLRLLLGTRLRPTRDANGFRKLVLLLSAKGKLLAQHTGGGEPLWARRWGPGQEPDRLLHWRNFHDVSHAPQVLVMRSSSPPLASVINAHSGEEVDTIALPAAVDKLVHLNPSLHDGTAEQAVYLAIPAGGGNPFLLPDTPEARAHLRKLAPSVYYWVQDSTTNVIAGYGIAEGQDGSWTAQRVWRLALPQPVLAIAGRGSNDPVHTITKVLGDRSYLIKYINPNTIFLATGYPEGSSPPETADSMTPLYLTAHIIDTVTGRILFRQAHPGGRGPVHAVFSENWVVYQYFTTLTGRLETTVLELYDNKHREYSPVDLISGRIGDFSQSSRDVPPLKVISQTYYARSPLKALEVTRTARGIASTEVLLGLATDQVYRMERRFLDARRPLRARPSKEDQEEGLVPYMESLIIMPTSYATFDKQVAGLRSIDTAPAALESTSHMLAYGVDVFYTRLQPAGGFDTLPDDFSYALLVLAMMALTIGAVLLHFVAKRAELKQKWQ